VARERGALPIVTLARERGAREADEARLISPAYFDRSFSLPEIVRASRDRFCPAYG
jgi:hypothetical protein